MKIYNKDKHFLLEIEGANLVGTKLEGLKL